MKRDTSKQASINYFNTSENLFFLRIVDDVVAFAAAAVDEVAMKNGVGMAVNSKCALSVHSSVYLSGGR